MGRTGRSRRRVAVLLAGLLCLCGTAAAEAAPAGAKGRRAHHHKRRRHKRRRHKRRHHKRESHKRPNMPLGFRWPPSAAMKREGQRCLRELDEIGVHFQRARRRKMIATPVVVPDMEFSGLKLSPIWRKPPFVMDCHLALALARHASVLTQIGVTELRFSSIYDYRRVRLGGTTRQSLSRHALGLAVDVFELVLVDGTILKVDGDYWSRNVTLPLADLVLRNTGGFRAVLTPAVDPVSHDDHFHLEAAYELPHARQRARRRARQRRRRRAQRAKRRRARRRRARRRRAERRRRARRREAHRERSR